MYGDDRSNIHTYIRTSPTFHPIVIQFFPFYLSKTLNMKSRAISFKILVNTHVLDELGSFLIRCNLAFRLIVYCVIDSLRYPHYLSRCLAPCPAILRGLLYHYETLRQFEVKRLVQYVARGLKIQEDKMLLVSPS